MYVQSCDTDGDIEVDTTCVAFYQKMVDLHLMKLGFWQNKLDSAIASMTPPQIESSENNAVIDDIEKADIDVSDMDAVADIEKTDIDVGDMDVADIEKNDIDVADIDVAAVIEKVEIECPTCAKGFNPVCAQDENENFKTFSTEDCMKADACNKNKTWIMVSSGVCDGDEDFMADSIVKPMIDDDFEIPIQGSDIEQDSPDCPECPDWSFIGICAKNSAGDKKSFDSEQCMISENCKTNSDWSKLSDGTCDYLNFMSHPLFVAGTDDEYSKRVGLTLQLMNLQGDDLDENILLPMALLG